MKRVCVWISVGVLTGMSALPVHAQAARALPADWSCGSFSREGRLDPEDFRHPTKRLQVVEAYHFGPAVEALVRPMQRGMTFGSDLDYTLWGYPNHHRALITLVKLAAREKTDTPAGASFTVDCYFARAFVIAPDDVVARMIYARYLGETKRMTQALANLKLVVDQAAGNPVTHLNAGLIYLELGAIEEAKAQAQRVSELGYSNDRLVEAINRSTKTGTPSNASGTAANKPSAPPSPTTPEQEQQGTRRP